MSAESQVETLRYVDGAIELLDQRLLPASQCFVRCGSAAEVAEAIRDMVVRGAPAIGVTAAYGCAFAVRDLGPARAGEDGPLTAAQRGAVAADLEHLAAARPTAVNLRWAVSRMAALLDGAPARPAAAALALAQRIHADDVRANRRLGELGAALIEAPCEVITHCNAGALATAGYGTALGVVRAAHAAGKIRRVLADETRPWLQGARLTAWELERDGIPVSLIADGAAAWAMHQGAVDWVIVGADRVAANGDVANKIGTLSLAVAARHHGVKFMVAAPCSTIDPACPDGASIPIEQRPQSELLESDGRRHAAEGVEAWNPVFDVTPASLVDALVTEVGVVLRPDAEAIRGLLRAASGGPSEAAPEAASRA